MVTVLTEKLIARNIKMREAPNKSDERAAKVTIKGREPNPPSTNLALRDAGVLHKLEAEREATLAADKLLRSCPVLGRQIRPTL